MFQLIIIIGLVIAFSLILFRRSTLSLPGPKGLPFVGYGPFVGDAPHLAFTNLARKYGNIFKIQLGNQEWVILNSKEAIQEVRRYLHFYIYIAYKIAIIRNVI